MRNKKLLTSAVALALAAVMLLGGTFAWQSISQTAENETANIVNPGGRLHDDFDGSNKDIYVENFGEEPIFARVRLEEYLALVINQGKDYAKTEEKLGKMTESGEGDTKTYTYTGDVYVFNEDNLNEDGSFTAGNKWWKWQVGSEDSETTYYMPTFNKNKDSLAADVNGWYKDGIGAFGTATTKTIDSVVTSRDTNDGQYEGYTTYTADSTKEANAIYDIDRNSIDELGTLSAANLNALIDGTNPDYNVDAVQLVNETHSAQQVGATMGLISMEDWLDAVEAKMIENNIAGVENPTYDIEQFGNYWVYDTDGWVYWSAPIMPGTATGLLLDGIQRTAVMDDSYYYGINVVAQFVTADDLGVEREELTHQTNGNGTGFYDTNAGAKPTKNAEGLLKYITDPNVDAYDPDTYAVFYEHEGEDGGATTYQAYYLSADSVSDAKNEAWGLSEDMNIAWAGKAANVDHDSDYVKNTVKVQVGGKYVVDTSHYDSLYNKVAPTGSMSGWFQNMGAETTSGADFYTGYYPSGDEVYTSTLDTSNVTDMSYLFKGAKFAVDVPEDAPEEAGLILVGWDTSSVTDMSHMFENCANLVWLELDGDDWDTSSVTDMSYMFSGCTLLKDVQYPQYWDTSSVTDVRYMFNNCGVLELDCSEWDVSNVVKNDSVNYRVFFSHGCNEWNETTNPDGTFVKPTAFYS